ncbi:MAG: putative tricarboxylic transport rane protein [Sulfurospirillum sp.]|jgi:putative tricarboxylic transport membrane protein|nr:putative tricarboxylic transport rane protein [Sulfurospirillum sp.]DAB31952.1 MAG TPA: tricarboxylic transporter [Sulfurospirillum sp. UBA11407]DAB34717.1 MAG TPA: tricarboxylic transporter [Sulfurospirillum sp. UBA12182]
MSKMLHFVASCAALVVLGSNVHAFEPNKPLCLAPAKPGGGFDLTCRLVSNSLTASKLLDKPMIVNFMPGGVGAVAYNHVIGQKPDDANMIVAASTGSALNIAQGKFGAKYSVDSVRWLAALGADYGAVIVKADAKWNNLNELVADLKANPKGFVLGSGGSIGSQDWFKAAIIAKLAGINPKDMKYVAFEGGGEALTALMGNHIQIYPGDIAEFSGQISSGKFKVLALLSEERLPGQMSHIPTAKEQGFDAVWTIWRGFYLGPKVSDEEYDYWVNKIKALAETPEFKQEREARGLYPFTMIGKPYHEFMQKEEKRFKELAKEAGLLK